MDRSSLAHLSRRTQAILGVTLLIVIVLVASLLPWPRASAAPSIAGINVVVSCDTSALINFNTDVPSHAYVEYGATNAYGSATLDDTVRFYKEHAIQLTGLTANTVYHYRIVATGGGVTTTTDLTFQTAANGNNCPAQPVQVDTRMPDMSGAVEKVVKSDCTGVANCFTASQYQSALDDARVSSGKRIITVDAGLSLVGQWTHGNKVDNNQIIVRTSQHAQLPEGKRVSPSDASKMFKLTNTNVDATFVTASGAHHWRYIGAEITVEPSAVADAPGGSFQSGVVRWGTAAETAESQWPHHMVLDRCYVHGQPSKNTVRGVYNNGTDNAVIDSFLSEFHGVGGDSQAILHSQGRRLKIVNNYLEAAGEPFMSGGVGITVSPATTPSDFEFTHNFIAWKLAWKTNDPSWEGKNWTTKNHFEMKWGKKALVFANVFDKWWSSEQTGGSIALKSSNDDKDPVVVTQDILWYKNHHKNLGSGIAIDGSNWPDEESTDHTSRLWFIHNLWEINGDVWNDENSGAASRTSVAFVGSTINPVRCCSTDATTTSGSAIVTSPTAAFTANDVGLYATLRQNGGSPPGELIAKILSVQSSTQATLSSNVTWTSSGNTRIGIFRDHYVDDWRLIHNTFTNGVGTGASRQIHAYGGAPVSSSTVAAGKSDNLVVQDNIFGYGIYGIKADGLAEGNVSLNAITNSANRTWSTNLVAGSATDYPTGNTYVANFTAIKFVNFNNGLNGNYRLAGDSPGKNAASDGTDIGVDIDALERATESTIDGDWPTTASGPQNVVWTGLENATATGSSLQKTSGTSTDMDAGGYSTQSIVSGDGYVEFKKPSTTPEINIALSKDHDPSYGDSAYDYMIVTGSGGWAIYENGVYQTDGSGAASNDVFKIEISAGVVRYYRNGSLIDTSSQSVVYPVKLVCTIKTPNGTISEAKITQ